MKKQNMKIVVTIETRTVRTVEAYFSGSKNQAFADIQATLDPLADGIKDVKYLPDDRNRTRAGMLATCGTCNNSQKDKRGIWCLSKKMVNGFVQDTAKAETCDDYKQKIAAPRP